MAVNRQLSVAIVGAWFDADLQSLDALLTRYFHIALLAESLSALGHKVNVIHAFHRDEEVQVQGVSMHAIGTSDPSAQPTDQMFQRYRRVLDQCAPDVVHLLGLTMWRYHQPVIDWARQQGCIRSWGDHGGAPERWPLARFRQKRSLDGAASVFFPSESRADLWRTSSVWPNGCHAEVVAEVSTGFRLMPQKDARARTGLTGVPIICCSGNLLAAKRPILALKGFEQVLHHWPEARLYMAYRHDDLLDQVQAVIDGSPRLQSAVTLLGPKSREQMELIYNSADIFLTTSEREIGSISLSEAFACGAQPVYTDLPSLRALTRDGSLGAMIKQPTPDAVAKAILSLSVPTTAEHRSALRQHFDDNLGYGAIARHFDTVWQAARGAA